MDTPDQQHIEASRPIDPKIDFQVVTPGMLANPFATLDHHCTCPRPAL